VLIVVGSVYTCVHHCVHMCVHHCVHMCANHCVWLLDAAQSSDSAGVARKREAGVWYTIMVYIYIKICRDQ